MKYHQIKSFACIAILFFLLPQGIFSQEPFRVLWQEKSPVMTNNSVTYYPYSSTFCSIDEGKICRWQLSKKHNMTTDEFLWVVDRADLTSHVTNMFEIIPSPLNFSDKTDRLLTNPQREVLLVISPNGRNFLIRYFNGNSHLYNGSTGQEIVYKTIPENESLLGFDKKGDLFCGTQCLNPLLKIRNIETGEVLKEYNFQKMSYVPNLQIKPEYWLGNNIDTKFSGLLYSTLPAPFESFDDNITLIVLTVFQFEFHLALVIIYDNTTNFVITQSLVDTTNWYEKNNVFFSSYDNNFIAIHDGRQKLLLFDKKNRCFSKECNLQNLDRDPFLYITKAQFLSNGQIALSLLSSDGNRTFYLWNPSDGIFSKPFWTNQQEIISVSPNGRYIATSYKNSFNNLLDLCNDNITLWDTETRKEIHRIKINSSANIFFTSDWSLLEIHQIENNEGTIRKIIDLSMLFENKQNINIEQNIPIFRTWRTSDGKFSTEAQFVSVQNNKVTLKKQDGKEITVPIEKLSDTDRTYIEQQH
jgi:hypothetical protein